MFANYKYSFYCKGMKKVINFFIKNNEYKDIHGNKYLDNGNGFSEEKINGEQTSGLIVSNISNRRPAGYNEDDLVLKGHASSLDPNNAVSIEVCGKTIKAVYVKNIIDKQTKHCELQSFMPKYNKTDYLCDSFDIAGIPIRLSPNKTLINIRSIPIIENGNIKEFKFYQFLDFENDIPFADEWAKQDAGSIEKTLHDIVMQDKEKMLRHRIALDNGRIIHTYWDIQNGGSYIDVYKLTLKKENEKCIFSANKVFSTKVDEKIDEPVVVDNELYTYEHSGNVVVYDILDNGLRQRLTFRGGFYNMQDFFNITNLKTGKALSRNDYAKMEKRYIEEKEKKEKANISVKPTTNNKGSDINLKSEEDIMEYKCKCNCF